MSEPEPVGIGPDAEPWALYVTDAGGTFLLGVRYDGSRHFAEGLSEDEAWERFAKLVQRRAPVEVVDRDVPALIAEVRRLRALIGRYAEHVSDCEGADFTDRTGYGKVLGLDELDEIANLTRSIRESGVQP